MVAGRRQGRAALHSAGTVTQLQENVTVCAEQGGSAVGWHHVPRPGQVPLGHPCEQKGSSASWSSCQSCKWYR